MIKLQAARCPQCNADIEVNKDLEKTICQYCGTTILVSDAIQKIELSGKVKVEGIKNRDDFLNQAKKHFEVKEYNEAKKCLNNILQEDSFDIEAYCLLIKINLELLKESNFNIAEYLNNNQKNNTIYQEYQDTYDRVLKIDKNNERLNYLGDYLKQIEEYENELKKYEERTNKNREIIKKLNEDFTIVRNHNSSLWDDYKLLMKECFNIPLEIGYSYINFFEKITPNSIFKILYDNGKVDEIAIFEDIIDNKDTELDKRYDTYCNKIIEVMKNLDENQKKRDQQEEEKVELIRSENYKKYSFIIRIYWIIIAVTALIDLIISVITKAIDGNVNIGLLLIMFIFEAYPIYIVIKKLLASLKERKNYLPIQDNNNQ